MPYVTQEARKNFELALTHLEPEYAGELNYCITRLCSAYLGRSEGGYRALNEIIGVLECAKMELYRRVVVPYEDKKLIENGDVY